MTEDLYHAQLLALARSADSAGRLEPPALFGEADNPLCGDRVRVSIKLDKGSPKPHMDKVGKLTRKQAEEIATKKMPDLNAKDMDGAVRIVAGSARSMGIEVKD